MRFQIEFCWPEYGPEISFSQPSRFSLSFFEVLCLLFVAFSRLQSLHPTNRARTDLCFALYSGACCPKCHWHLPTLLV